MRSFLPNTHLYLLYLQPADEHVQVHFLETSDDRAILDPDDILSDVVDDKDKVLLSFPSPISCLSYCFYKVLLA